MVNSRQVAIVRRFAPISPDRRTGEYLKHRRAAMLLLLAVMVSPLAIAGCEDTSNPELNSTRSELEAFLEEHPNGLSEDVAVDGQE